MQERNESKIPADTKEINQEVVPKVNNTNDSYPAQKVKLTSNYKSVYDKFQKSLGRCIGEHKLIEANDKIALALSGGKDSWTLLFNLFEFQKRSPIKFEVVPVTVSTGFAGFDKNVEQLSQFCKSYFNKELVVIEDTFPEIIAKHKTPGTSSCSFCARMRRGALYTKCQELGFNKLALGHHADDIIESMLMSQMFNGRQWTMAPKMKAKDKLVTVIRPMAYTFEQQIRDFIPIFSPPIVTCNCEFEGDPTHNRAVMKRLVGELCSTNPQIRVNLLKAAEELFNIQVKCDDEE